MPPAVPCEPPWRLHPELHRWSSIWLEHPRREAWQQAIEDMPRAARVAYLQTLAPIPVPWMDVVASLVDGCWEHEREEEIFEQMARVEEETGLVSLTAYLAYLDAEP